MKNVLILLLVTYSACAQTNPPVIKVTSSEVVSNSVRVITSSNEPVQNVVFRYVAKTSEEIKATIKSHPRVQVVRDGNIVAETIDGGCGGYLGRNTNYVGLILIFTNYSQAKLVEKTLRGY